MPSPNPPSGAQPHEGQTRSIVRLALDNLTHDPVFSPRMGTAKEHVHDLARTLRNGGDLDPIKVWPEPGTGRLVIIDGRQRVAAYRLCQLDHVPALVFHVDRKAARLEAARDNAKARFPWTTSECTQYAWGLVVERAGSKREIVQAANVASSTIANIRKRLAEMTAAEKTPTGNWWADRNDKQPDGLREDISDGAKQARIDKLREGLVGTEARFKIEFGRRPSMEELGVAMRWHLGQPRFKAMASGGYLADEDEFSSDAEHHPLVRPKADPSEAF